MTKLKPYTKYKDSGVDWLGEIPSDWTEKKFKIIFRERTEKNQPKEPLLASTQKYVAIFVL